MWGVAQLENFRLKVFRTVAQHLSFRKAAEHLFITQPAVTLQIKALEEDLGVRLFDRRGNQIFLTAQGNRLLGYAKQMEALVAEAEQDIAEGEGQLSGEFSLGASTTIAQYVLTRLIGAFLLANRNHRPDMLFDTGVNCLPASMEAFLTNTGWKFMTLPKLSV